jgi:uncharacterized protein YndB with AHSA1/START domain
VPVVARTLTVGASIASVWQFVSDFTTTEEWDPPTVSTERTSGDGGLGSTYRNVMKIHGRRTEVDYVVTRYVEGHCLELRGAAIGLELVDTITVDPTPEGGSRVTYAARFTPRHDEGFTLPSMTSLGDFVAESLQDSLEHLG